MARPGQKRKPDPPKKRTYGGVSRCAFTVSDILRARLTDEELVDRVRRRLETDDALHALRALDRLSEAERGRLAEIERAALGNPLREACG